MAKTHSVPLIEDAIGAVLSDPMMKSAPLHPNAAGHALLEQKFHAELKSIGYAR